MSHTKPPSEVSILSVLACTIPSQVTYKQLQSIGLVPREFMLQRKLTPTLPPREDLLQEQKKILKEIEEHMDDQLRRHGFISESSVRSALCGLGGVLQYACDELRKIDNEIVLLEEPLEIGCKSGKSGAILATSIKNHRYLVLIEMKKVVHPFLVKNANNFAQLYTYVNMAMISDQSPSGTSYMGVLTDDHFYHAFTLKVGDPEMKSYTSGQGPITLFQTVYGFVKSVTNTKCDTNKLNEL